MVTTARRITLAEIERDGPPEGQWEIINGELIEMPPAGGRHSRIGMEIGGALLPFVKPRRLGLVYNADAGFILAEDPLLLRAPDVSFVRTERLPPDHDDGGYLHVAPDLAVEIISKFDRPVAVLAKAVSWLEAGVSLVWVVAPASQTVTVISTERDPRTLTVDETLDGGAIVPGFTLPLRDIFAT
ncbi:MAG: Uma2 family endonuclease [Chloroflexota bacterium]|nr:Uma2 family endonuclease [Chloroflexota bacterium]